MNHENYQAVITDYRMPQMDGLDLLSKIRGVNPTVKRILISAFEIDDELFRGCNCVDRFLHEVETLVTKPNLENMTQSPN